MISQGRHPKVAVLYAGIWPLPTGWEIVSTESHASFHYCTKFPTKCADKSIREHRIVCRSIRGDKWSYPRRNSLRMLAHSHATSCVTYASYYSRSPVRWHWLLMNVRGIFVQETLKSVGLTYQNDHESLLHTYRETTLSKRAGSHTNQFHAEFQAAQGDLTNKCIG